MTRIEIKRAYEAASDDDGYRVLIDRLWPRGIRKEALPYDFWAKDLAPSAPLRVWFHADPDGRWPEFRRRYTEELKHSDAVHDFLDQIARIPRVTLIYASKNSAQNHALILRDYLESIEKGR